MKIDEKRELIAVARGDLPADLLLKNARVVNTLSLEIEEESVAVYGGRIAGIGAYDARMIMDLHGAYLSPSFIDAHIHLESSLLAPAEFARAVVPNGTGAVIADPHEIANVCGVHGIRFMLSATRNLPIDVRIMLPSCVPATSMETSGTQLEAIDLLPFLNEDGVLGLAEVMNYPGVIQADLGVLEKIRIANSHPVDGHAPGVRGKDLNAYAAAGIGTDHESTTLEEAREKLRRGLHVLIREGSTAHNLRDLLPLITSATAHRFALISDDRHADDLLRVGHVNAILSLAVAEGLDPLIALSLVTINPASMYGLSDLGAIAPGRLANLVVLSDLRQFKAEKVLYRGEVVAEGGRMTRTIPGSDSHLVRKTVKLKPINESDLRISATGTRARVIGIVPDQIVTTRKTYELPVVEGCWVASRHDDIAKLVVVERHGRNGNVGRGFVQGLGLQSGALASTVAHDSHNLVCAGMNDRDMLFAIRELERMEGGLVAVRDQEVLAALPLPVAGLMSDQSAEFVVERMNRLHSAAKSLGCGLKSPFMALAFLALPVIPALKLTDCGLVDVEAFKLVELGVDE